MNRIAIYDMDRTVTRHATYTPFLLHAARTLHPWRLFLAPFVLVTISLYLLKLIDRARLKEWNQALLLGRAIHPARLAPAVDAFAERTVATNVLAGAVARLAADRAEGYRLVLATASYRLYAAKIAERLGFDDVIATNSLAGLDTRVLARIDGENCYGPAKLRMVTAWLHDAGIARADAYIRFYIDHVSDAPVLDWAD
ncbi:MAG: HAD-IB family phosphatase, partial [Sphingomonadaceae bacterium]|nr:HAD-IB family phosphatase [Sphingomonadaceae bacterium]